MPDRSFLSWPFFDEARRAYAARLNSWAAAEIGPLPHPAHDDASVDAACREILKRLAEGGWTRHVPDGEKMFIYDASVKYKSDGVGLIVIAGKEYGSGSSRDWAAKGTLLLGVKAVIAESFERIHRSNLVQMGVLPLQFTGSDTHESLGLTGEETFDLLGIPSALAANGTVDVIATTPDGRHKKFQVKLRIDTPQEAEYYRNGGILPYVLRQLVGAETTEAVQ